MAETPTAAELKAIRSDLDSYTGDGLKLSDHVAEALKYVKRQLEDVRGILWTQVYDSDNAVYYDDEDANGRNDDRLKNAIGNMTAAYVFKDYAVTAGEGSKWWELYLAFRADADNVIKYAKLDVDLDESGDISTGEEAQAGQSFMTR